MTYEDETSFDEGHFESSRRLTTGGNSNKKTKSKFLRVRPYEVDDFSIIDDDDDEEGDNRNKNISSLKIPQYNSQKTKKHINVFPSKANNFPLKSEGDKKQISKRLLLKTTDTTGSYSSLSNNSFELTVETDNLKLNIKDISNKLSLVKKHLIKRDHNIKWNINSLIRLVIKKIEKDIIYIYK